MHAKSIGEFRLTWDSAIAQSKLWSQPSIFESIRKNDLHFLADLSPNLGAIVSGKD